MSLAGETCFNAKQAFIDLKQKKGEQNEHHIDTHLLRSDNKL